MSLLAWIYLLSLAGLWSGAFLATELILNATGPWTQWRSASGSPPLFW